VIPKSDGIQSEIVGVGMLLFAVLQHRVIHAPDVVSLRTQVRFPIIADCVNGNGTAMCEGRTATPIRLSRKNRGSSSGAGSGETSGAIVLEINNLLSLTCLISTGAPWLHTAHQCRSIRLSRVLVLQLSQTKSSFFMRHH
jgi:hypothetical protein